MTAGTGTAGAGENGIQECDDTFMMVYTAPDIFKIVQQQSLNKIFQYDSPLK
jgi:hypothetical protein